MRPTFILILMISIGSCLSPSNNKVAVYYDIDSLITAQHMQLVALPATVKKTSVVDSDTSSTTLPGDSAVWSAELNIFRSLDINKSVLDGLYKVENTIDTHSNLMVQTYTPIGNSKVDVKYLKLYYLNNLSDLRKLEGKYLQSNLLYSSEKVIHMKFDKRNNKPYLVAYDVTSHQTMRLQSDISYQMNAVVEYNKY